MTASSIPLDPGARAEPSARQLVVVPAILTLAITLLRFAGELEGWSPRLFGTAAGGGGSLVGISWLMPVFGAWFGWRLAQSGRRPASRIGSVVRPLVAFVLFVGVLTVAEGVLGVNVWAFAFMMIALPLCALLAATGWRELARTLLLYGFAARVPVMAITVIAVFSGWGTHYEKMAPHSPAMAPALRAGVLCLTQLGLWVSATVVIGGLFGGLAASLKRR